MTDRQYVTRACQIKGIDLIAPTRKSPGILGTHWVNGFGRNVIDAQTWSEARKQIDLYFRHLATA